MTVRFTDWLEKPRGTMPITRVVYRTLDDDRVHQLIAQAEFDLDQAKTGDDQSEAEFALQELRAVLQERR